MKCGDYKGKIKRSGSMYVQASQSSESAKKPSKEKGNDLRTGGKATKK